MCQSAHFSSWRPFVWDSTWRQTLQSLKTGNPPFGWFEWNQKEANLDVPNIEKHPFGTRIPGPTECSVGTLASQRSQRGSCCDPLTAGMSSCTGLSQASVPFLSFPRTGRFGWWEVGGVASALIYPLQEPEVEFHKSDGTVG